MQRIVTTNTRLELAMVSADIERLKLDLRDKLNERRQLIAHAEWRRLSELAETPQSPDEPHRDVRYFDELNHLLGLDAPGGSR